MKHEEAIKAAKALQHLVGKPFRLPDGETETVKAVVAWDEGNNSWEPHVCFYDWTKDADGKITHLSVREFESRYHPVAL